MNAQVGKGEIYRPTIGSQSLHENTNDNGYRLIEFAILNNNMMIGSTRFQHRNIHKPTWTAPDRSFENQIDHVVIDAGTCPICWMSDQTGEEMWTPIII